MTTRKFSVIDLPHPRYSLEVGRFTIKSPTRDLQQEQQQHEPQQQLEEQKLDSKHQVSDNNTKNKSDGTRDDDVNLPSTCLPRFSQLAQVIEVKLPGFTLPNRVGSNIKDFLGSYCIIENARPELFVRRDFISKFVDKGTIHVAQLSDQHESTATTTNSLGTVAAKTTGADAATTATNTAGTITKCGYKLSTTIDNKLIITMNSKQYHRFGMLAKKEILPLRQSQRRSKGKLKRALDKCYRIEINLNDRRIMTSNKYQDKLMQTLRRLSSINKIYFRFIPDKSKLDLSLVAAHEYSLEFFNCIINEYILDGCLPIPLSKCTIAAQKVNRNWINRSQLHPPLGLGKLISDNQGDTVLFQSQLDRGRDDDKLEIILGGVIDIIDWCGYQLLSLDCDKLAKIDCWLDSGAEASIPAKWSKGPSKRYDVSCTRILGPIDCRHVQNNLHTLFTYDKEDDVVFRAMFLYDAKDDKQLLLCDTACVDDLNDAKNLGGPDAATCEQISFNHSNEDRANASAGVSCANSGVVYLQDCSNGPEAARGITVIGLSELIA